MLYSYRCPPFEAEFLCNAFINKYPHLKSGEFVGYVIFQNLSAKILNSYITFDRNGFSSVWRISTETTDFTAHPLKSLINKIMINTRVLKRNWISKRLSRHRLTMNALKFLSRQMITFSTMKFLNHFHQKEREMK